MAAAVGVTGDEGAAVPGGDDAGVVAWAIAVAEDGPGVGVIAMAAAVGVIVDEDAVVLLGAFSSMPLLSFP